MERLMRLASVLHNAGPQGVPVQTLLAVAGFADAKDGTTQLTREFRHMRELGWQIDNIGERGEHGRYRMTTVDNRLTLRLTPGQQAALRSAVLLADRDELVDRLGLPTDGRPPETVAPVLSAGYDDALSAVLRGLRLGSVLTFRYGGHERTVHPSSVRTQNNKWYLVGREEGDDILKTFVASRMGAVGVGAPGSAERQSSARHHGLHPMTWEIDPPIEVVLRAPADFVPDVHRWLGEPQREEKTDDGVRLVYLVTHRAALRRRVYELGPRVEVVGPEEIRDEIIAELEQLVVEA